MSPAGTPEAPWNAYGKIAASFALYTTRTIGQLNDLRLREPLPAAMLRVQLSCLPAKAAELQNLDKQIFEAVGDDELENEQTAAEEYKQNINRIGTQASESD